METETVPTSSSSPSNGLAPVEGFANPWLNLEAVHRKRTSIIFDNRVLARIHAVYPRTGVAQTLIAVLLTKLAESLDKADMRSYDPELFQTALAGCEIKLKLPRVSNVKKGGKG